MDCSIDVVGVDGAGVAPSTAQAKFEALLSECGSSIQTYLPSVPEATWDPLRELDKLPAVIDKRFAQLDNNDSNDVAGIELMKMQNSFILEFQRDLTRTSVVVDTVRHMPETVRELLRAQ